MKAGKEGKKKSWEVEVWLFFAKTALPINWRSFFDAPPQTRRPAANPRPLADRDAGWRQDGSGSSCACDDERVSV